MFFSLLYFDLRYIVFILFYCLYHIGVTHTIVLDFLYLLFHLFHGIIIWFKHIRWVESVDEMFVLFNYGRAADIQRLSDSMYHFYFSLIIF